MTDQPPIVELQSGTGAGVCPAGMSARMPDCTNLGARGHGLIGRVDVEIGPATVSLVGRYSTRHFVPLVIGMLAGTLLGLFVGTWFAPPFGEHVWQAIVRAVPICAGALLGGVAGVEIVKYHAIRTAPFARLVIPLESVRLLRSDPDWRSPAPPKPGGELAQGFATFVMRHFRSPREVVLTAPTHAGSRELLRLVMDDPDDARSMAARLAGR